MSEALTATKSTTVNAFVRTGLPLHTAFARVADRFELIEHLVFVHVLYEGTAGSWDHPG
jgi:hypothetical protein